MLNTQATTPSELHHMTTPDREECRSTSPPGRSEYWKISEVSSITPDNDRMTQPTDAVSDKVEGTIWEDNPIRDRMTGDRGRSYSQDADGVAAGPVPVVTNVENFSKLLVADNTTMDIEVSPKSAVATDHTDGPSTPTSVSPLLSFTSRQGETTPSSDSETRSSTIQTEKQLPGAPGGPDHPKGFEVEGIHIPPIHLPLFSDFINKLSNLSLSELKVAATLHLPEKVVAKDQGAWRLSITEWLCRADEREGESHDSRRERQGQLVRLVALAMLEQRYPLEAGTCAHGNEVSGLALKEPSGGSRVPSGHERSPSSQSSPPTVGTRPRRRLQASDWMYENASGPLRTAEYDVTSDDGRYPREEMSGRSCRNSTLTGDGRAPSGAEKTGRSLRTAKDEPTRERAGSPSGHSESGGQTLEQLSLEDRQTVSKPALSSSLRAYFDEKLEGDLARDSSGLLRKSWTHLRQMLHIPVLRLINQTERDHIIGKFERRRLVRMLYIKDAAEMKYPQNFVDLILLLLRTCHEGIMKYKAQEERRGNLRDKDTAESSTNERQLPNQSSQRSRESAMGSEIRHDHDLGVSHAHRTYARRSPSPRRIDDRWSFRTSGRMTDRSPDRFCRKEGQSPTRHTTYRSRGAAHSSRADPFGLRPEPTKPLPEDRFGQRKGRPSNHRSSSGRERSPSVALEHSGYPHIRVANPSTTSRATLYHGCDVSEHAAQTESEPVKRKRAEFDDRSTHASSAKKSRQDAPDIIAKDRRGMTRPAFTQDMRSDLRVALKTIVHTGLDESWKKVQFMTFGEFVGLMKVASDQGRIDGESYSQLMAFLKVGQRGADLSRWPLVPLAVLNLIEAQYGQPSDSDRKRFPHIEFDRQWNPTFRAEPTSTSSIPSETRAGLGSGLALGVTGTGDGAHREPRATAQDDTASSKSQSPYQGTDSERRLDPRPDPRRVAEAMELAWLDDSTFGSSHHVPTTDPHEDDDISGERTDDIRAFPEPVLSHLDQKIDRLALKVDIRQRGLYHELWDRTRQMGQKTFFDFAREAWAFRSTKAHEISHGMTPKGAQTVRSSLPSLSLTHLKLIDKFWRLEGAYSVPIPFKLDQSVDHILRIHMRRTEELRQAQ